MRTLRTLVFLVFLSGVDILTSCVGANNPVVFRETIQNSTGSIQSPNFGQEYNKSGDHVWRFNMREGKVLMLNLTELKIFYYDEQNNRHCGDAYKLIVQNVDVDCTKNIHEGEGTDPVRHLLFYKSRSCSRVECTDDCSRLQLGGAVEVEYYGSDGEPFGKIPSDAISGFKMTYEYLDCPSDVAYWNGVVRSHSTSRIDVTSAYEENVVARSDNHVIYGTITGGIVVINLLVIATFCIMRDKRKKRENSTVGIYYDVAPPPYDTVLTTNLSRTSEAIYQEITSCPPRRTSIGGDYNYISVASPDAPVALYETPGYQTVTLVSNQASDPYL